MALIEIRDFVDARGTSSPLTIELAALALEALGAGECLEVIATDPAAVASVEAWCRVSGNLLVQRSGDGASYAFVIRRT